jgi:hypothetical protein
MPVLELTDEQVIALLQQLPCEQKKRILTLLAQAPSRPESETAPGRRPLARRPEFGSAKKDILSMAEDFDAPLEDFKEYM